MAKLTKAEINAIVEEICTRLRKRNSEIQDENLGIYKESEECANLQESVQMYNDYINLALSHREAIEKIIQLNNYFYKMPNNYFYKMPTTLNLDKIVLEAASEAEGPQYTKSVLVKSKDIENKVVLANLETNGKFDVNSIITQIINEIDN
jgi:hypothetical protein